MTASRREEALEGLRVVAIIKKRGTVCLTFRIPEGWTAANGSYSLSVNENGDASSILGITSCPGGSYCLGGLSCRQVRRH